MRTRHFGEFRFSTRFLCTLCGFASLGSLLIAGCGGEPPAGGGGDQESAEVTVMEDAVDSPGPDLDSQSGSSSTPIPAKEEGIQMPELDAAQPEAVKDGGEKAGPVQPGEGGLEMPEVDVDATKDPGATSAAPAVQAGAIPLKLASWQQIRSAATSGGKITVVDLWSTSCAPCIKEFPGLVRLSKSMPDQVRCIGVSVDYDGRKTKPPETYTPTVSAFLKAVGAEFDNYLCNTPSDDVFAEVDLPSIPAVLIFDADGQLVKRFVDAGDTIGFSYDKDVIPFVEKIAG